MDFTRLDPQAMRQLANATEGATKAAEDARMLNVRAQAIACLALNPQMTFEFEGREELQKSAAALLIKCFDDELSLINFRELAKTPDEGPKGTTIAGMIRGG